MQDVLSLTYWSGAWDRSSRRPVRDPCDQCPITQRVATMSPKWLVITLAMKVSDYTWMLEHILYFSVLLIHCLSWLYYSSRVVLFGRSNYPTLHLQRIDVAFTLRPNIFIIGKYNLFVGYFKSILSYFFHFWTKDVCNSF